MQCNPLNLEVITGIVDILLESIENKLASRDIKISLTQKAKDFIAKVGFDPYYGARPLKRALYDDVEDKVGRVAPIPTKIRINKMLNKTKYNGIQIFIERCIFGNAC